MVTMKMRIFLEWFVLLCGCEAGKVGKPDVSDTMTPDTMTPYAEQIRTRSPMLVPIQSACENHLSMVGTMDLSGEMLTPDNEIAIPRSAHNVAHYLSALPYSQDGDEMIDEELVWGIADNKLGVIIPHAWNSNTVEVYILRDFFDGSGKEPETVAGVCVQDSCEPFEPVIYPRPSCAKFYVTGLINLEGIWRMTATTLPLPIEVNVSQKGRTLTLTQNVGGQQSAFLHNDVVRLETDSYRYECTLTSRVHCDGVTIDVQTGTQISNWFADKQKTE